jgi:hypothetical protein
VRIRLLLLGTFFFAVSLTSCKERGGKYMDQGEIHFTIDYVGYAGATPKELLPKNVIVSFKKDKILFEMTGIGNSGILNLSNPEKGIYDTYYSFFTYKYFYAAAAGEMYPGFEAMEGMVIRKTSKTSVICGFNCKNAEVTFPSRSDKIHEIWYTDEINVQNPNAFNPFKEIDGVLMSFFFILGPSEMRFEAETVYKKDIPDETFDRRSKFVRVSREDITGLLNKMKNL